MNRESHCSVCGRGHPELVVLPGVGSLCQQCLLDGRFLSGGQGWRLQQAAERLLQLSREACRRVGECVGPAERAAQAGEHQRARQLLLEQAERLLGQKRRLLAATLLLRALRLPGPSGRVYELLAQAAEGMGLEVDAVQHLKTASWLALKVGDWPLFERALASLERLRPGDEWIARARQRAGGQEAVPRCSRCGRTALETGGLITGEQAAVCTECVKQLLELNGTRH